MPPTDTENYSDRLKSLQDKRWKKWLSAVNPYRWHIRRIVREPALEVGCGIGRVLQFAPDQIEGVDHNPHAVVTCRERGLNACDTEEFLARPVKKYQSLILSHVLEHMSLDTAHDVLSSYLPNLDVGGKLILICPQERGYRSDATHEFFMDYDAMVGLCKQLGLSVRSKYSFPFPRSFGELYIYNEFVVVAEKVPSD